MHDLQFDAVRAGIDPIKFWEYTFEEIGMVRTAYFENLERNGLLMRELYALTYNLNVKKGDRKRASELIPFQHIEKPYDAYENFQKVKSEAIEAKKKWFPELKQ